MQATIPLQNRKGEVTDYALLDSEDLEWLASFRWRTHFAPGGKKYVIRGSHKTRLFMHQQILGPPEEGMEVDHINRDGLDNRRSNLRFVTHSQNLQNKSSYRGSTSPYRGVHWNVKASAWRAVAHLEGHQFYLGQFADELTAARVVAAWRAEHMPFSEEARGLFSLQEV